MITNINQIKTDGTLYYLTFIPFGYRLHHDANAYVCMDDPDYNQPICQFSFENDGNGGFHIKNAAGQHYIGIVSDSNNIGSWSSPFSWSIFSEGNYEGKSYAYFSIRHLGSTTEYINYPSDYDNRLPIHLIVSDVISDTDFNVHDFFIIEEVIPNNIIWTIQSGDIEYDISQYQKGAIDSLPVNCFAQQNLYNTTEGASFTSVINYATSQTSTITWTLNEDLNINSSIQIELKIPFIGSLDETLSIKADVASNQEWSTETEIGYNISTPLAVSPQTSYQASLGISWGSNLAIPFTIPLVITAESNGVSLTGQEMSDILETTKSNCKINSFDDDSISVSLSGTMHSSYGLQTNLKTTNAPILSLK